MTNNMPDYLTYHQSLTDELHALKDRIRNLATHWPTDGEYKEAALRTVLRRHLPSSLIVGRGFIVTPNSSSTQLDLLIVDGNSPTLFRDGDLLFVTPDCVRAIIEVKTSLNSSKEVKDCATKLASVGRLCRKCAHIDPWLGIFSYEGTRNADPLLLNAVKEAAENTDIAINCVAYGKNHFVRYWSEGECEQGDDRQKPADPRWRIYRLENLASSYFVGNVVDSLSNLERHSSSYAWFPLREGKKVHPAQRKKEIVGQNHFSSLICSSYATEFGGMLGQVWSGVDRRWTVANAIFIRPST
jgi:hypothetical protein